MFNGSVVEIQTHKNLHIVNFQVGKQTLCMMSLELPDNLHLNSKVQLYVKPTHISIGKDVIGEISFASQLQVKVKEIQKGTLVSSVTLVFDEYEFEAIVSTKFIKKISIGDEVVAFIKASELSIGKVLNV